MEIKLGDDQIKLYEEQKENEHSIQSFLPEQEQDGRKDDKASYDESLCLKEQIINIINLEPSDIK